MIAAIKVPNNTSFFSFVLFLFLTENKMKIMT